MDTVIKNGLIVTVAGTFAADIGISDGRIVQIGGTMEPAFTTIDAAGCYVMPGAIDVHTHLDTPVGDGFTADDFGSGTIAAACGGTTAIVDFCKQDRGRTLAEAIDTWDRKAAGKAAIDYGYHVIITDPTEAVFEELPSLPERGITSFKVFMAGKGFEMIDDLTLIRLLDSARQIGALVMVHAENGDAVHYLQQKFVSEGKVAPLYQSPSRPARVEAEATARAIALAEVVGGSLYVVHLTCEEALDEVVRGKMRGVNVMAETCTQYLYTTKDDLDRDGFEGAKFVFCPPGRTIHDQEVLWRALRNGLLETVSSDHFVTTYGAQKDVGRNDFTKIPNGGPGIEERVMMLYQGVNQGHISLAQFVDLVSTRPARVFGLYPSKGTISVGADADILIWDPNAELTITNERLHHAVDYTNYADRVVKGIPKTVLLRGRVIVQDRQYVGSPGEGRFIKRHRMSDSRHPVPKPAA